MGFNFGSFNGGPLVFTLSNGDRYSVPAASFTQLGFVGFISTRAITSISIGAPANDPIVIGDLAIGQGASPNPESSSTATHDTGRTVQPVSVSRQLRD